MRINSRFKEYYDKGQGSSLKDFFSQKYGIVKFVKVGEEYRFASNYGNHINLVKEDEKASSAGFVIYGDGYMRISTETSMSLNWLGPHEDDGENISKLTGLKLKK